MSPSSTASLKSSFPASVLIITPLVPRSVSLSSRFGEPFSQVSEATISATSPIPSAHKLHRKGSGQELSPSPQKSK